MAWQLTEGGSGARTPHSCRPATRDLDDFPRRCAGGRCVLRRAVPILQVARKASPGCAARPGVGATASQETQAKVKLSTQCSRVSARNLRAADGSRHAAVDPFKGPPRLMVLCARERGLDDGRMVLAGSHRCRAGGMPRAAFARDRAAAQQQRRQQSVRKHRGATYPRLELVCHPTPLLRLARLRTSPAAIWSAPSCDACSLILLRVFPPLRDVPKNSGRIDEICDAKSPGLHRRRLGKWDAELLRELQ